MELPFDTENISLTIMEVTGVVTDRRTEESERITFYRPMGNSVIQTLEKELDAYGYDFKQVPDSVYTQDIKIPVSELTVDETEEPSEAEPDTPSDDSGQDDGNEVTKEPVLKK